MLRNFYYKHNCQQCRSVCRCDFAKKNLASVRHNGGRNRDSLLLLLAILLLDVGQQIFAHFLGISKKHNRVGVEKDWVIHASVAGGERTFNHNHLV